VIQLSSESLYDYFSLATSNDSATVIGKKLFDFVDRKSNTLVVTIGDSWTWGADLTQCLLNGTHLSRLTDDDYRIHHVFGNQVANSLSADFLNLGESGSGNWHIYKKIQELQTIADQLAYKKVIVISVVTELGRDFNSCNDLDVDYRSWLLNNIHDYKDYYKFFEFINSHIAQKIHDVISKFDSKFHWLFANNFVDPIGVDVLKPWWVPQTWLQIIIQHMKKQYVPVQCYTVFPWVIEKFDMVFDVAPELDRVTWLQWINEISDLANQRAGLCFNDGVNFGNLLHPSAPNHRYFAEYLLTQI
jgi:hypothetical protein